MSQTTVRSSASGFGCLGSIIAVILSAALNGSFWWGVLHFLLSWIYVLYVVFFRTKEILPAITRFFT